MLTSINEELGKQISFDIDKEKAKKLDWYCPLCGKETTYVKKSVKGKVEHFRHLSAADHPNISESKTHSLAKKKIFQILKQDNNYQRAELERKVDDQIIDIYLELSNGNEVAVEIQCTPQGKQKFKERTEKYDEKGIHTLWILQEEKFFHFKSTKKVTGIAFKKSTKWIQNNWFGRLYQFSEKDLEKGKVKIDPVRLKELEITRSYGNKEITVRSYKSIGNYVNIQESSEVQSKEIDNYGLLTTESFDFKIARFYDKKWWG